MRWLVKPVLVASKLYEQIVFTYASLSLAISIVSLSTLIPISGHAGQRTASEQGRRPGSSSSMPCSWPDLRRTAKWAHMRATWPNSVYRLYNLIIKHEKERDFEHVLEHLGEKPHLLFLPRHRGSHIVTSWKRACGHGNFQEQQRNIWTLAVPWYQENIPGSKVE